jgi:hypothetical protein
VFAAGVGVITGTATEAKDAAEAAQVVGVVQITPTVGNCVNSPVQQFLATGVVVSSI